MSPTDRYQSIANSPVGGAVAKRLGLPAPPILERHEPGKPVVSAPVALGSARGGRLEEPAREVLRSIEAHVENDLTAVNKGTELAALVFDASGIDDSVRLGSLYEFFHPLLPALRRSGRVVVLATPPDEAPGPRAATAQRAAEGFVRSVAKEIGRRGSTAQLVQVGAGAEGAMESTLRFLLSARSAFVDGQAIRIEAAPDGAVVVPADWDRPLDGRVAAVTGSARGIGEAIATTLAEQGAHVLCVDIPSAGEALSEVANGIGGTSLALDITDPTAPGRLADHVAERHGRLDALVHNAGITRDKTLARMQREAWDAVLDVNLSSQERINDALLERGLLREGGRLVSVSSVSGIAGNRGQSNYATSKAGIIGMVAALAGPMRERRATVNAVAPGFIETAMTAAMPVGTREAGRRTSSLVQGGLPVDVAETIAWLASPASAGVNGNVVRVCGQALIGA
ncbi:MAG TPA: 3-oxoacyl-ACP reductase [Thermoleophilaceae bacterium]|nr:3-oxoacyl-ACP reductase [Thermoleophilaceae bacterium]